MSKEEKKNPNKSRGYNYINVQSIRNDLGFYSKAKVLRNTPFLLECTVGIINKSDVDTTQSQQLFWTEMFIGEMDYFEIE